MLDSIFFTICNMSFIASYVIVFVTATRLLLVKTPKIYSYCLWSVVLFRLLCPFSFESNFSVFTIAGKTTQEIQPFPNTFHTVSNVGASNEVAIDTVPLKILEAFATIVDPLFRNIFTLIWLIGIATMLIFSICKFVKLKKQLVGATPLRDNIYLADHINSPFVMGLIQPRIYLPSSLSDSEQDYIIAHENHHIKRLDHLTRILSFIALAIHWFNPFVWLAFVYSGKDMELSCDEAVMKKMDTDIRADYAQSLLRFATGRKLMITTPLAFGEGDTKDRVTNVMNYKKPMVWVSLIAMIAVVCIAVGLMSNPKNAQIEIEIDETIVASDSVIDTATQWIQHNIENYNKIGADPSNVEYSNGNYSITQAKLTGLTEMSRSGTDDQIILYCLEYRLKASVPENVMLVGGMSMENGWITEWGSTGQPHLLFYSDGISESLITITNTDTIFVEYGSPDMMEQYGTAYTAAATELYEEYLLTESIYT